MFHNKFIFKVSWSSDTLEISHRLPAFQKQKQLSKGRLDLNCDGTKNEDNEKVINTQQ